MIRPPLPGCAFRRLESGRALVAVAVLARRAAPASPRLTAGLEGRLREPGEGADERAQPVDARRRPFAAGQDAVEFRHRPGQTWFVVVQPNLKDASPGEREPLELDRAG